jgi:THAP4-like, heme-binding beta-barrel domain
VTVPSVDDTTDLRRGAPIHDRLLALLPLVGVWTGDGAGVVPSTGEQFAFTQRVTFAHDGRPFLAYESRSWLVDAHGVVIRPAMREAGFWRPGPGEDDIEVQLVNVTGLAETFTGLAGDLRWELATDAVVSARSAREVDGERRLYAVRDDTLAYATELALPGQEFAPHLNGSLHRD